MISPSLVRAYEQSSYEVKVPGNDFYLQIGSCSKELDALLQQHGAVQCAFITADNPGSVKCTEEENQARRRALTAEIEKLSFVYYGGRGIPRDSGWQPEISASCLIYATEIGVSKMFPIFVNGYP